MRALTRRGEKRNCKSPDRYECRLTTSARRSTGFRVAASSCRTAPERRNIRAPVWREHFWSAVGRTSVRCSVASTRGERQAIRRRPSGRSRRRSARSPRTFERPKETTASSSDCSAAVLEELNSALPLFSCAPRPERAEVTSPARFGIALSRVQPVFARRQLPNHRLTSMSWPGLTVAFSTPNPFLMKA